MGMNCFKWYKNWYLIIVCLIYSLSYFYRNSVGPIADVLEKEFNTTSTGIGMLSSFLYGSYFSMQIVIGLLLEIYSYHILILFSSFFLGISLIAFSFTTNITMGIIIRFISGFIVSPPYISGIAMSSQLFGNKYVSMYSGLMFFSGNLLVLFSGYLQSYIYEEYGDWKSVYLFFGICALFTSIIFFMFTIYEYFHHHKLNQSDSLLLSEKSEISLEQKPNTNYNDYNSIENTKGNTKNDIINTKDSFFRFLVYRHRAIRTLEVNNIRSKLCESLKLTVSNKYNYYVGIQAFCCFVIIFAMNGLWVINYLMVKYKYSRQLSSIISGVFFMGTAFGSLVFGKLGQIYLRRIPLLFINTLIMTLATLIFIYLTDEDTPVYIIFIVSGINGFGSSALTPIHYAMVREYNNYYKCEDAATGFVNVLRNLSGFLPQLLMGIMIDINWMQRGGNDYDLDDGKSRNYSVSDYNFAFSLCTISVGMALVLLIFLKETYAKNLSFD